MASENKILIRIKVLPTSDPTLPPFVLQVTQLINTYMIWIGLAPGHNIGDGEKAVKHGNLCKDWACAMPPLSTGGPPAATSLFRSASSDVALSISQRLAKRFRKQIFLSADLPLSLGQGDQLVFEAEKGIVESLKAIENAQEED